MVQFVCICAQGLRYGAGSNAAHFDADAKPLVPHSTRGRGVHGWARGQSERADPILQGGEAVECRGERPISTRRQVLLPEEAVQFVHETLRHQM